MRAATSRAVPRIFVGAAKRVCCLVLVLISSLVLSAHAARAPRDTVWTHADVASRAIREIAVLPAVYVLDDGRVATFVEARVGPHFCNRTRMSWITPDEARRKLERRSRHPYTQLDSIARQVWKSAQVDSLIAGDVARQLGVQSVLCLRVDRWERLETWETRRMRASVGLRAALVDSGGAVLWTISGESSSPTSTKFQADLAEYAHGSALQEWGVPVHTGEMRRAPDFDKAIAEVLERWTKEFPLSRP